MLVKINFIILIGVKLIIYLIICEVVLVKVCIKFFVCWLLFCIVKLKIIV